MASGTKINIAELRVTCLIALTYETAFVADCATDYVFEISNLSCAIKKKIATLQIFNLITCF